MEPVSSLLTGYLTGKAMARIESAVRTQVVQRWNGHRAQHFFEAFCDALLNTSTTDHELEVQLDDLLSDEVRSQIVFEAYRSVCLTKSRVLGPRIIAVQTAEIVSTRTTLNEVDEMIFAAAEQLTDAELQAVAKFVDKHRARAAREPKSVSEQHGYLDITVTDETIDSNCTRVGGNSIGPIDLRQWLGMWALKLKQLGLLSDFVVERQWRDDADGDELGIGRKIVWSILLPPATTRLAQLVRLSTREET